MFPTASRIPLNCCLASRLRRRWTAIGVVAAVPVFYVILAVTLLHRHVKRERSSSTLPEFDVTPIELMSLMHDVDCAETFLQQYEKFCEAALLPAGFDIGSLPANGTEESEVRQPSLRLCPCVPRHLLNGRSDPLSTIVIDVRPATSESPSSAAHYGVDQGGHWSPSECVARQRIAVIIPFRDREVHLEKLLQVLHPMLQRQLVAYSIFVVEQFQPTEIFNKASVMNAGFLEVRALEAAGSSESGVTVGDVGGPFDCYVFHDVDMLPEDDRNFYGCGVRLPRHVGAYVDKFGYELFYYRIFGGVTSFRPEVFELVNGYSNEFYGWGGEDDDMLNRIEVKHLTFIRFPKCVATYSMIKHGQDKTNKEYKRPSIDWRNREQLYNRDGLNSVRYKLTSAERRPLYTWLLVSLPPVPK